MQAFRFVFCFSILSSVGAGSSFAAAEEFLVGGGGGELKSEPEYRHFTVKWLFSHMIICRAEGATKKIR